MSGRLRTAGLWLVGCVAVLVVTSIVASIGAPPRETAPAPVQPAAPAPVGAQDAGAAPAPRLKSLLEHYDLERLHEAGASTMTSTGLGTMDPSGYAAAREVLRGYGEALQQHIELTGVLRPRSAALQRLDALDQVSAALQNLPPAVLATVGSEVGLQLVELETIALARRGSRCSARRRVAMTRRSSPSLTAWSGWCGGPRVRSSTCAGPPLSAEGRRRHCAAQVGRGSRDVGLIQAVHDDRAAIVRLAQEPEVERVIEPPLASGCIAAMVLARPRREHVLGVGQGYGRPQSDAARL